MSPKMKLVVDIVERVVFTYLAAFVGLLATANLGTSSAEKIASLFSTAQVALVACLPALLTLVKTGFASLAGNRDTAAALPAALDNGA